MNKVVHISKEIMLYILKVIGIILGVSAAGIIIFLFLSFLSFHIVRPLELRKIPDYVAKTGNEQVYIPDKVGDERYDNGGKNGILYLGWIFNLDDEEMTEALKYVEEYPDAWNSVDDITLSRIDGEYDGKNEIDINTAEKIAKLRGISLEEIAKITNENTKRFYGI